MCQRNIIIIIFFFVGGRLNRPRDRCRLIGIVGISTPVICLRLKLPTRERLFPCTRCYGAIPVLGVWEYLYGTLRVQMVTEGGDFVSHISRLTGWRNPPLTNRRSVVAVDLTTGLPFHCNDNLLGSRQLRGIEPGSSVSSNPESRTLSTTPSADGLQVVLYSGAPFGGCQGSFSYPNFFEIPPKIHLIEQQI